jgi:hypothetical protein
MTAGQPGSPGNMPKPVTPAPWLGEQRASAFAAMMTAGAQSEDSHAGCGGCSDDAPCEHCGTPRSDPTHQRAEWASFVAASSHAPSEFWRTAIMADAFFGVDARGEPRVPDSLIVDRLRWRHQVISSHSGLTDRLPLRSDIATIQSSLSRGIDLLPVRQRVDSFDLDRAGFIPPFSDWSEAVSGVTMDSEDDSGADDDESRGLDDEPGFLQASLGYGCCVCDIKLSKQTPAGKNFIDIGYVTGSRCDPSVPEAIPKCKSFCEDSQKWANEAMQKIEEGTATTPLKVGSCTVTLKMNMYANREYVGNLKDHGNYYYFDLLNSMCVNHCDFTAPQDK